MHDLNFAYLFKIQIKSMNHSELICLITLFKSINSLLKFLPCPVEISYNLYFINFTSSVSTNYFRLRISFFFFFPSFALGCLLHKDWKNSSQFSNCFQFCLPCFPVSACWWFKSIRYLFASFYFSYQSLNKWVISQQWLMLHLLDSSDNEDTLFYLLTGNVHCL